MFYRRPRAEKKDGDGEKWDPLWLKYEERIFWESVCGSMFFKCIF